MHIKHNPSVSQSSSHSDPEVTGLYLIQTLCMWHSQSISKPYNHSDNIPCSNAVHYLVSIFVRSSWWQLTSMLVNSGRSVLEIQSTGMLYTVSHSVSVLLSQGISQRVNVGLMRGDRGLSMQVIQCSVSQFSLCSLSSGVWIDCRV